MVNISILSDMKLCGGIVEVSLGESSICQGKVTRTTNRSLGREEVHHCARQKDKGLREAKLHILKYGNHLKVTHN